MPYRALNAGEIIKTVRRLHQRIDERFPGAGLASLCLELLRLSETAQARARRIGRPQYWLRALIVAIVVGGVAAFVGVANVVRIRAGETDLSELFQGVEAAINIAVLAGAALFFLITIETRMKRRRALNDLHELRSVAHVIDMHQLTKDPAATLGKGPRTISSPTRTMSRYELSRYLDYCAEMLALTGKLAALYAQNLPDPVLAATVNEIETLTGNLSAKIWQKIAILETLDGATAQPIAPRVAVP